MHLRIERVHLVAAVSSLGRNRPTIRTKGIGLGRARACSACASLGSATPQPPAQACHKPASARPPDAVDLVALDLLHGSEECSLRTRPDWCLTAACSSWPAPGLQGCVHRGFAVVRTRVRDETQPRQGADPVSLSAGPRLLAGPVRRRPSHRHRPGEVSSKNVQSPVKPWPPEPGRYSRRPACCSPRPA